MARWREGAAERLEGAALDLFEQEGFPGTTVAQIAQRAGLTTRTFYNHFPDKREVLFSAATAFQDRTLAELDTGTVAAQPFTTVLAALVTASRELFEPFLPVVARRNALLGANAELREREAVRRADLTRAVTGALTAAGVVPVRAEVTAAAAVAVHDSAFGQWVRSGAAADLADLADLVDQRAAALRAVVRGGEDPAGEGS